MRRPGWILVVLTLVAASVLTLSGQEYYRSDTITRLVDGTAAAPSLTFASASNYGLYLAAFGVNITAGGTPTAYVGSNTVQIAANSSFQWSTTNNTIGIASDLGLGKGAGGRLDVTNGSTIGTTFNVSGLPSVSACGAGSPAVGAGSTALSGSVTVGTGGPLTCTITFNGTAYPSAARCSGVVQTTTAANVRAMGYSATTTVLTIVPATAWVDSSVVNWNCWSSK